MHPPASNYLNLTGDELDQPVYRIMEQNHVFSLFAERRNQFRQIRWWKDKFENFQMNLGCVRDGQPFDYDFRDDFVGQCWSRAYLSDAMWSSYASDPDARYLRIRSTPRRLLAGLVSAHPIAEEHCFIGKVVYRREHQLKAYLQQGAPTKRSPRFFARSLLLKRRAFKHESEVRLIYCGDAKECDAQGFYGYPVDPHAMITQIMADPNRDRCDWSADRAAIQAATGFAGEIKRSMIYDPPDWNAPIYASGTATGL